MRIKQIGFFKWLREVTSPKQPTQKQVEAKPLHPKLPITPKLVSKVKPDSVGYPLAMEFIRLAKVNADVVTYAQCEAMCPAYPGDPASWARAMGLEITTERKNKLYKVVKYA